MKFSYFPGCTLKNKATELDLYTRASAKALDIDLEEIENWQCCGGAFTGASDEIGTKLSSVRILESARENGLVTVCSACHNVVKQVNSAMANDKALRDKVNRYMGSTYCGDTKIYHYLELLRDVVGFDKIKERVQKSLNGLKVGAYYGCLLLRPSGVMKMDDPENPTIIEGLISALGGTPVIYAMRNECCGGYITLKDRETATKRSLKVLENAKKAGAELIVTACPLCLYNLKRSGNDIPVIYFTELLAKALGVKGDENE